MGWSELLQWQHRMSYTLPGARKTNSHQLAVTPRSPVRAAISY